MVEGVTEFLPVSSTGHLIVVGELLGARVADATFEIGIQFGAVLAVIWFSRRELATRAATATSTDSWVF